MSDTLSVDARASLEWLFQDVDALTTISDASKLEYKQSFSDGTSDDEADVLWHDERTLSVAANEDFDLTALARTVFGNATTVAMATVKAMLIVNTNTAAGEDLSIGNAASNAWVGPFGAATHTLDVPADSSVLLVNRKSGWSVSASSADMLRIANNGTGDITYRIALVGTSV
ncbi:MAG: hypothetical protein MI757_19540 [Pirellulales bacterium]|nr:hypothetical protein [Pirellulales bacterium]